ncbi:MAG: DarT ssDNA thymidine ADP-ribosyltransferase family protein [Syntrophales bacterium]
MKPVDAEAQKAFEELVGQRRFVYHIMTKDRYRNAVLCGHLASRNALGNVRNDYAIKNLVAIRSGIQIDDDTGILDTVPFYLTPRQPMFCRLVREGRVKAEDLMALGFDFDALHERYKHWLFTSNPAYEGSRLLGRWDAKGELGWEMLLRWWWNSDSDVQEEKLRCSFLRQAELLVKSPVDLDDVHHIVVHSGSRALHDLEIAGKVVTQIVGIFDW